MIISDQSMCHKGRFYKIRSHIWVGRVDCEKVCLLRQVIGVGEKDTILCQV